MIFQLISLLVAIQVVLGASTGSSEYLSNEHFTTDLFSHVTNHDNLNNKNLIFSPASIHICLALAYFGAKDTTASEIANVLHFTSTRKHVIAKQFEDMLEITRGPTALIKIANKIYSNNLEIKPEFNTVAKKSFESEVENLDFTNVEKSVSTINHWVAERTNNQILNFVDRSVIEPDTKMVLVNAIHFKGNWKNPFVLFKSKFFNDGTNAKDVQLMKSTHGYFYANFGELDCQAIKLPYENSELRFMILLPNERTGLHKLEEKLKSTNILDLSHKMAGRYIEVIMPKFKIESEIQLENILKDMGMKTMFSSNAHFDFFKTDVSSNIDKVIHKAFVDVSETGTEAAAATAATSLSLSRRVIEPPDITFTADHPFFFAILDHSNVYFTGHLINL